MSEATTRRRTRDDLLRDVAREPLAGAVALALRTRCGVESSAAGGDRRIIVGTSGGPDSMALLVILAALAKRRSAATPSPIAVCVHHGLRPEAEAECQLVARCARWLGVPCERLEVRPAARPGNLSENARADRYAALAAAAQRHDATVVATAHHADDRLETMLLAIARGRGLRGISSPRWRRSLGGGVRLVRPLLASTKAECIRLCERFGIPWATDPSNDDPARGRGHLRRAVLPGLRARAPRIAEQASHLADEAAMALAALEDDIARRFGNGAAWPRAAFTECEPPLAAWVLRRAAATLDRDAAVAVPRRAWQQAARAACDATKRPRVLRWPVGFTCTITANTVSVALGAERRSHGESRA